MARRSTLEQRIEELYGLPLAEFVGARNALAVSLAAEGNTEKSQAVRALDKPPVSAWAVNCLYHHSRSELERLIRAGRRVAKIQSSGRGSGVLQEVAASRREIVDRLRERAAELLRDAGHAAGPGTLRRIETTLDAIATRGDAGPEQRLGRLTRDLEPLGFDALLGLGIEATGPSRRPERVSAARDALREAELRLPDLRREVKGAEAESRASEKAARRARAALEELRSRLAAARDEARGAEAARKRAALQLARATDELQSGVREVEKARRALEKKRDAGRRS